MVRISLVGLLALLAVLFAVFSVAAIVFLIVFLRRRGFKPPEPLGQPTRLCAIAPNDAALTQTARWVGTELEVTSEGSGVVPLFEVPMSGVEQCMLTWRFKISTDRLESKVYPEMWCRIPGRGEFFSRGLNQKVRGNQESVVLELPFYLKKGQRPDLLKLNMVFEGAGTVRLQELEILATPLGDW